MMKRTRPPEVNFPRRKADAPEKGASALSFFVEKEDVSSFPKFFPFCLADDPLAVVVLAAGQGKAPHDEGETA